MRPVDPAKRLSLLTFPQSWEPNALLVRFLCMPNGLPQGNPEDPLQPGEPAFAAANLVFEAHVIRGLENLPRTVDAVGLGELALDEPPINKAALFAELRQQFRIVPRVPAALAPNFRKPVTESYLSLTGRRQLSKYLTDEKDFECALHDAQSSQPAVPAVLDDSVTWGRLLAFVLRQPKLAMALGLIGKATIPLPDPTVFDLGGWLFIDLHATSDYAAVVPPLTSCYAARIPPLNEARSLYAAVLFPVDGLGIADDLYPDAERYDLGFARMVHGAQSDGRGDSIQLAWDDEQVAEWLNRQVDPKNEAPMGTAGYRVDVREPDGVWNSLLRIESAGDLMLGALVLGPYSGESIVEVMPAQIAPARAGEFWMPPYFTTWRGSSLALTDSDLVSLHAGLAPDDPESASLLLNREQTFLPVDDKLVPLRYGKTYEFRVRLADLTRGGPPPTDDTPPVPHAISTINFQRRACPAQIIILQRPTPADTSVKIAKPRIGYPEALFTGKVTFAKLAADVAFAAGHQREISVPDPDVLKVEIVVAARALEGDVAPFLPLYTTTRQFDADEITLKLKLEDRSTLDLLAAVQPDNGPLVIPTARDIRLTLVGLGRDDPGYFAPADERRGRPDPRRGLPVTVDLRAPAQVEEPLFAAVDTPLRSFFFRLPPADGTVASPAERLAQELGLDHTSLTLAGRPGHRTVIGCSANLHHTLSPERAAITISSEADVIQHWINVLRFTLARDWTWDGLTEEGITVHRRVVNHPDLTQLAGTIRLPHALAATATTGVADDDPRNPVRQATDIFFFDSFDPKPKPGEFPTEITIEYEIAPAFKGDVPEPDTEKVTTLLPIVTPPVQVPKLVSAGIALSKYEAADDYSSTEQRRRSLWLEFEAPPLDRDDAYFVRVLANAPDPMLTDENIPEVIEPPLPIEPEWMRFVLPEQPHDDSGLRAMDILDEKAKDGLHYVVPLPKGMSERSLELLGMFTYEIRLGHTSSRWSTAQGRFGPPLRVAGVQHPAPPLVCQAARTKDSIRVRAPFATPVHNGRNVRLKFPKTQMWAVLYARVRQTDAASWRNLLLARARLLPPHLIIEETDARMLLGEGRFLLDDIQSLLKRLGLPDDAPLTTLAVEFLTDPIGSDPLGRELGHARMLRVSPLIPVPDAC